MDVSARTNGAYFRNNVWWWRPLAEYVQLVLPIICKKCDHWHSNDGDGLDDQDSGALARRAPNRDRIWADKGSTLTSTISE